MNTITLGELLTPAQVREVTAILNDRALPDMAKTDRLKALYRAIEPPLEQRGIVPDFLAYATIHAAQQAWTEASN